MGFTDPHEHLHAVPPPCQKDRDLELSSYENSVQELFHFKEVGGRTLVEASTLDYGRDLKVLKRMAQETGVHIIATTGFNKHIYYPPWVAETSMEEIAGMLAKDVMEGGDGSDAREEDGNCGGNRPETLQCTDLGPYGGRHHGNGGAGHPGK